MKNSRQWCSTFALLFRIVFFAITAIQFFSLALAGPEMCIEMNAQVSADSNLSPTMREEGERFVTLNPGDSLQTEIPFYTLGTMPCYGYREKTCTAIYRGCFSADRLKYDGQNAFQISIKWPFDGSPVQTGNGQMSVQLVKTDGRGGRNLCNLNWIQGSEPVQTCRTTVFLSLQEIDPELWQRTQNLAAAIQNIQFLEGNLNTLRAEVARYEQIVAEFTGLTVAEVLARLDSLRGDPVFAEIANAIAETRGEYQALKQRSTEALAQASSAIGAVDAQTKQLVEGMKVAGIALPDLPVLDFKFPPSNAPDPFDDIAINPYAAIANTLFAELNSLCPQSPCTEKGPAVIARVLEWQAHAEKLREALQLRSRLSPKEAIAFETAVTDINEFLQKTGCGGSGCLKADLWLNDSSVPQATRTNISQNIEPVAPDDAAALRKSLADWRGTLTPEQKLVLQMIDALGIFYKNSVAVSEDLKQAAQVKLRSLTQSVASTATAVARVGVSFTPAGDIIDFCELATGKEFCNPNGKSLNTVERTFAGIGIFLGSGKLWRSMAEGFEATSEVGKAVKFAAGAEEAAGRFGFTAVKEIKAFSKVLGAIETLPVTLRVTRIRKGTDPNKIAIIGRSMGNAEAGLVGVRDAAAHLKGKGVSANIFEASPEAWLDFIENHVKPYRASIGDQTAQLPANLVERTRLFRDNTTWANRLKEEGFAVLDIGNPNNLPDVSAFYEMEKSILFP